MDDREALSRIYANSDLFIHPNGKEPFGIAPLEAMASGVPVIAPDSGGIKSYADESNSFLVSGSAESFAHAVCTAMSAAELRQAKAQAGRLTAKRFSWPAVTDSFLELYDSIYSIGRGGVVIRDAAPAFCSTAADSVQTTTTTLMARTAQAGFMLYSKLAGIRSGAQRASTDLLRPQ